MGVISSADAQNGWPRASTSAGDVKQLQTSPALFDLDDDGFTEIIVPRLDDMLYIYAHDGSLWQESPPSASSFPVNLGFGDGTFASPAIGDVDGDGHEEIVFFGDDEAQQNASIRIFSKTGSLEASVTLDNDSNASGKATPCLFNVIKYESSSPYAAHDALEIIVRDGDGQIHIVQHTSGGYVDHFNNVNDWKTVTDDDLKDRAGRQFITPSVSAMALSSSETYLVAPSTDGKVYHWTVSSVGASGQTFDRTKLTPLDTGQSYDLLFTASATLADLDDDDEVDVIAAASDGNVYIWDGSDEGGLRTGWPQLTGEGLSASPILADINSDGSMDVIAGSQDSKVYVWNLDGTIHTGWPFETRGDILAAPVVANLDGSDELELVVASAERAVYVVDSDGEVWNEWPKRLDSTLYASPAVADLRNSGKASLLIGEYDGYLYCFDLPYFVGLSGTDWTQYRGGIARTGSK